MSTALIHPGSIGPAFVRPALVRRTSIHPAQARPAVVRPESIHSVAMPAESPLTLTARGRRLLGLAALAVVLLVVLLGGRAVAGSPAEPIPVDTYTVSAGESLWAIASAYTAPHEDVRDTMSELVELNGLAGGALRAGEQILVPAG